MCMKYSSRTKLAGKWATKSGDMGKKRHFPSRGKKPYHDWSLSPPWAAVSPRPIAVPGWRMSITHAWDDSCMRLTHMTHRSRKKSDLKYLDLQITQFFRLFFWVTETPIDSRENLLKSWGLPWKLVSSFRGLPWKLVWNFGSRNYFKSDLLRAWYAWDDSYMRLAHMTHMWETTHVHLYVWDDAWYAWDDSCMLIVFVIWIIRVILIIPVPGYWKHRVQNLGGSARY